MLRKILLILLLAGTSFAWWDGSFSYRMPVTIMNGGSALSDYQTNISLNTQALVSAGKMRADCGDIRITNSTDSTLPYWIETGCNTMTTKIWVKIPAIASDANMIYIYYGNATATYNNTLGGNSTFLFFDDFSAGMSKWGVTGSPVTDNGALKISGDGNYDSNGAAAATTTSIGNIIEFKLKYNSALMGIWGYSVYPLNAFNKGISFLGQYTSSYLREVRDATVANLVSATVSDTFIPSKIVLKPTQGYALYYNNILQKDDTTWTNPNSANKIVFEQVHVGSSYIDDVRVRKYASPEPTTAAGAEEERPSQYTYRQQIEISNSGSALTDYQINITIDTAAQIAAGKMKSDCADLRFTNSTSYNSWDWAASYQYWIETGCNSTQTKIWVKAPSIPTDTSTIYAYYGNSSAVPGTNGNSTFEFFDDFPGTSIDASKWTVDGAGGLSVSASEAVMVQAGGKIRSVKTLSQPFIIETKLRSLIGTTGQGFSAIGTWASTSSGFGLQAYGTPGGSMYRFNNGAWGAIASYNVDANPRIYRMAAANAAVNLSILPLNRSTVEWTYSEAYTVSSQQIRIGQRYDNGGTTEPQDERWDWVLVRKYASPEPTATEQQPDTTAPSVSIQSPNSTPYTTSTVPVNFTATDNIGISSCTVRLNGTVNSSTCDNYSLTLANGAYLLNVSANDTAGNVNSSQVPFTVAVSGGGQQSNTTNTTQATTDNNGIADGNVTFTFEPKTLAIKAGTQDIYQKTITTSAGVTKIGLKTKLTLKGQAAAGKSVTYTLSDQ